MVASLLINLAITCYNLKWIYNFNLLVHIFMIYFSANWFIKFIRLVMS